MTREMIIVISFAYRFLQLNDPNPDFTDIAKQLADVTAIVTHEQSPLQTGDLRLAVDVIEKIAQRGFDDVNSYPPNLRGEKVRNIAQVNVVLSPFPLLTEV